MCCILGPYGGDTSVMSTSCSIGKLLHYLLQHSPANPCRLRRLLPETTHLLGAAETLLTYEDFNQSDNPTFCLENQLEVRIEECESE